MREIVIAYVIVAFALAMYSLWKPLLARLRWVAFKFYATVVLILLYVQPSGKMVRRYMGIDD